MHQELCMHESSSMSTPCDKVSFVHDSITIEKSGCTINETIMMDDTIGGEGNDYENSITSNSSDQTSPSSIESVVEDDDPRPSGTNKKWGKDKKRRQLNVKFASQTLIHPIVHVRDMSKKTKGKLWFTCDDFYCIEQEGYKLIHVLEKGKPLKPKTDEYHSVRGLEKLLERNAMEYISLRRETLGAVFEEQAYARQFFLSDSAHSNMMSQNNKKSNTFDDKIAHAYGQTCMIPRIVAVERAKQDYKDILHYTKFDPSCAVDAVRVEQMKAREKNINTRKNFVSLLLCSSKLGKQDKDIYQRTHGYNNNLYDSKERKPILKKPPAESK